MIGALGIPRDSKKGTIGTRGIPKRAYQGLQVLSRVGSIVIPRDSKKE